MKRYDVVVIPGDGIGHELTEATVGVLEAVAERHGFELAMTTHEAGASLYRKIKRAMTDETLAACRTAHGVLKGPVGDPGVRAPDGTEAGVLGGVLRPGLDAYANIRPIRLYPGVTSALANRAPGSRNRDRPRPARPAPRRPPPAPAGAATSSGRAALRADWQRARRPCG